MVKNYNLSLPGLFLLLLVATSSCKVAKPFTLILLPDTQIYAQDYPEIFAAQTQWIVDSASNTTFVLHQGDIANRNKNQEPLWIIAEKAMSKLDGKVPYTVVPGNHDIGKFGYGDTREADLFNKYFPYSKHSKLPGFGGAFEEGKMENTWYTFEGGGLKWLILSLEFGPRNKVLEWAGKVVAAHPTYKIILNTHAYLYSDETRLTASRGHRWSPHSTDYGMWRDSGENAPNDGEEIWDKLVSRYPNMMMTFSGHVLNDGAGRLVSTGVNGNKVYQMLANYQGGVIGSVKGGNGFLRIVTIDPARHRISVKSYSPYIKEFNSGEEHQFEFTDVKF